MRSLLLVERELLLRDGGCVRDQNDFPFVNHDRVLLLRLILLPVDRGADHHPERDRSRPLGRKYRFEALADGLRRAIAVPAIGRLLPQPLRLRRIENDGATDDDVLRPFDGWDDTLRFGRKNRGLPTRDPTAHTQTD